MATVMKFAVPTIVVTVFMVIAMLILPAIWGGGEGEGVWLATPVAEFAAICLSVVMFAKYRKNINIEVFSVVANF